MTISAQVIDPTQLGQAIDTQTLTVWDFVWAVVIVAGSFLLAAVVRRLVRRLVRRFEGLPETYGLLIARASGWFVIVVGVIYALTVLGVNLGPAVIALLLVAAIAFFAGRGLLENFGAGLVLQGTNMFEVGDQIETAAGAGTVHEITGRTVVLRTPDGEEINVPNSIVVNEAVTNLTKQGQRRSTIPVGVAYGTDLEEARRVIQHAAAACELALTDPAPEALVNQFDDSAITINLRFWHDPTILGENRAIDQVVRRVSLDLAEHGIVIAFPQRTLWWGEGSSPDRPAGGESNLSR
jgi:small-conductance mechanosensitive channel